MSPVHGDGTRPGPIDSALAKELEKYKGKWVAVNAGKVVATGSSAAEAVAAALAVQITDPLVFRVASNVKRIRL